MVFSTSLFLFGFLPFVLAAYYAAPRDFKNLVLLVASIAFYVWGEPAYAQVLLGSIWGNYVAGEWLAKWHSRWLLAAAVAGNLLLLVAFKYANFLADNINSLAGYELLRIGKVHLVGISFFTFQGIAYVVDVYTRQVKPARDPLRYALYAALFPHLVAGPIVRYRDIEDQLEDRPIALDQLSSGVRRLVIGLAKKLLLANSLGFYADSVFKLDPGILSPGLAWLGLVCYTMQIYFDFSGYSDMAIGLGKLFGFTFLENFNYPYVAASITDFWRRWHISLSSWLRDYLYIPLGGNRVGPLRTYVNLMLVFVLCGLWHGAKWNFLIWGAWHGAFLIIERKINRRDANENRSAPGISSVFSVPLWLVLLHLYTLLTVMLGWVFFRADSLPQAMQFLGALIGQGSSRVELVDLWNRELAVMLAVAVPCCLPIIPWIKQHLAERDSTGWTEAGVEWIGLAACSWFWLMILPALCSGSFNPFLYFRF